MCGNILITFHHFFKIITMKGTEAWRKGSFLQHIVKSEAVAKTIEESS